MRKHTIVVLAVAALALTTGLPAAAQTAQPSPTYSWYGELVAFDANAGVVTLKSRLVGDALNQIKQFKAGQRVLLHWSGFDASADAIRAIVAYDAAKAAADRFLFPAELVTPDVQHDYATFKFRVPSDAASQLTSLKPGEWVTITSRHRPATEADAVVTVKPYSTSTRATTTS